MIRSSLRLYSVHRAAWLSAAALPAAVLVALGLTGCAPRQSADSAASRTSAGVVGVSARAYAGKAESMPVAQGRGMGDESRRANGALDDTTAPRTILPRKIIYTGELTATVEHIDTAEAKLRALVARYNGFVASANVTGEKGSRREGSWTLRVPVARFDALVDELARLGELQSRNIHSDDVSEEFYDVDARLKNKRVEEERLLQHLRQSTARLTDILAVEREISRVREEIERMEGRLRVLASQTDLSTITVTLHEPLDFTPEPSPSFGTELRRTLTASLAGVGSFFKAALLTLVALLPWALIAAAIGWPLARANRQRKLRRMGKVAPTGAISTNVPADQTTL